MAAGTTGHQTLSARHRTHDTSSPTEALGKKRLSRVSVLQHLTVFSRASQSPPSVQPVARPGNKQMLTAGRIPFPHLLLQGPCLSPLPIFLFPDPHGFKAQKSRTESHLPQKHTMQRNHPNVSHNRVVGELPV